MRFIACLCNVALAWAVAVTLLKRVAYAVFVVVYFLTEVPLLLSCKGASRLLIHKDALLPWNEQGKVQRLVARSGTRRD